MRVGVGVGVGVRVKGAILGNCSLNLGRHLRDVKRHRGSGSGSESDDGVAKEVCVDE